MEHTKVVFSDSKCNSQVKTQEVCIRNYTQHDWDVRQCLLTGRRLYHPMGYRTLGSKMKLLVVAEAEGKGKQGGVKP